MLAHCCCASVCRIGALLLCTFFVVVVVLKNFSWINSVCGSVVCISFDFNVNGGRSGSKNKPSVKWNKYFILALNIYLYLLLFLCFILLLFESRLNLYFFLHFHLIDRLLLQSEKQTWNKLGIREKIYRKNKQRKNSKSERQT